jgi:hypothetical protein
MYMPHAFRGLTFIFIVGLSWAALFILMAGLTQAAKRFYGRKMREFDGGGNINGLGMDTRREQLL